MSLTLTDRDVEAILDHHEVAPAPVRLLGVRNVDGGDPDWGVGDYEGRLYTVIGGKIEAWPLRTLPNTWRNGRAKYATGQVIKLRAGDHKISLPPGNPRRHRALRQARPARIYRQGEGYSLANIAANLHRGPYSIACQVVPPGPFDTLRDRIYRALGITRQQVRRSPAGVGPLIDYCLVSRAEAEAILSSKPPPPPPPAEEVPAPTWTYLLDGEALSSAVLVAGWGYARVRALLGRLTGLDPATLIFDFQDGTDTDHLPDLLWKGPQGDWEGAARKPIDILDAAVPKTLGRIRDIVAAAGGTIERDETNRIATLYRKGEHG
jgi:hypothetical protein